MGHKKKPPQEDSIMYTKQRNSGDPPPAARHKVLGSSQVLCFETRQILSISWLKWRESEREKCFSCWESEQSLFTWVDSKFLKIKTLITENFRPENLNPPLLSLVDGWCRRRSHWFDDETSRTWMKSERERESEAGRCPLTSPFICQRQCWPWWRWHTPRPRQKAPCTETRAKYFTNVRYLSSVSLFKAAYRILLSLIVSLIVLQNTT